MSVSHGRVASGGPSAPKPPHATRFQAIQGQRSAFARNCRAPTGWDHWQEDMKRGSSLRHKAGKQSGGFLKTDFISSHNPGDNVKPRDTEPPLQVYASRYVRHVPCQQPDITGPTATGMAQHAPDATGKRQEARRKSQEARGNKRMIQGNAYDSRMIRGNKSNFGTEPPCICRRRPSLVTEID